MVIEDHISQDSAESCGQMRRRAATSILQLAAARRSGLVGSWRVNLRCCSIHRTIRRSVVKPRGNLQARKARLIASPPRVFSTSLVFLRIMFVDMSVHMPQALVQQLRCHESRDLNLDKTANSERWCCEECGKLKHCEGA